MSELYHVPKNRSTRDHLTESPQETGGVQPTFPTFQQPYLKWFRICSCFSLDDSPLSKRVKHQAKTAKKPETRFVSKAGAAWIRLRMFQKQSTEDEESGSLEGGFLIECQLESWFPSSKSAASPPNTVEEVSEYLKLFFQQKATSTCCEGLFSIPQGKIPKRGFVGLMLALSAGVGKAEMDLTGATFSIQGRAPYKELRWRRRTIPGKKKTDGQVVDVTLAAELDTEEGCGCLEDVAVTLSNGIQEFVVDNGD